MRQSFSVGIGGAAGQGVATPGDIFAKIFSRRGLHLNVYNAYQSIIRGGHTFLTTRTSPDKSTNMRDRSRLPTALKQEPRAQRPWPRTTVGAGRCNAATALGGDAAGVTFYCAYPLSTSTGVLPWMADPARKPNIMVRQVEEETGVIAMAMGTAHAGVRGMCATSGGGFALMSEALGL